MPAFGVSASSAVSSARLAADMPTSSAGDDRHEGIDVALPRWPRRLERAGDEARRDQAAEAVPEEDERAAGFGADVVDEHRQVGEQVVAGGRSTPSRSSARASAVAGRS